MNTRLRPLYFALICSGAFAAAGQPAAPSENPAAAAQPPAPAPPLYQVEVLVFAHADFDPAEEHFEHGAPAASLVSTDPTLLEPPSFDVDDAALGQLPPSGATTDGAASDGTAPGGAAQGDAVSGVPQADSSQPPPLRLLEPGELALNAQARTLGRLSAYRLLAHGGWVQPGLPEDQAVPFDLALLGTVNPAGTIKVYLSRFLHAEIDLSYVDPQPRAAEPAADVGIAGDLHEVDLRPRYRLKTEHQVSSGDLQYFDHPAFGVLVKVTRVPANAPGGTRPAA